MAKRPVITPVQVGDASIPLNNNFQRIAEAFDEVVSREGGLPNFMATDLDLNSNDLLNVGDIRTRDLFINGVPIVEFMSGAGLAQEAVEAAQAGADQAQQASQIATTAAQSAEEDALTASQASDLAVTASETAIASTEQLLTQISSDIRVPTLADRPATGPSVGYIVYVLDSGISYRWSGTAWQDLGTGPLATKVEVAVLDADIQTRASSVDVSEGFANKADGGAMFHRADDEQVPISVSDDNQVLLGLDQFAEPLAPFASSRSLDRKADTGAGFYTGETDSINPVFTMGDNGRQVVGIVSDADGNLGFPWRLTFHVGDSDFEFAKIDETGAVLEGWDETFRRIYPAGGDEVDFSNLPISARSAADSQPWNDRWSVKVKRPLGDPYTVPVDTMFPTHRAIYDRCDALVAEYSDYITRTVIGQSVGGNDIVMYRATPPNYVRISGLTLAPPVRPKIILLGSTHSNEKHCVMANTAFFEGLVRDWRTREHLSELRWGCDLIYVPCVNPDGFDLNIRRNGNNVDINRNYPERWSSASAGERGPSPASELETQAIVGLFQAHPDAIAAIDHHRMFRIASGPDAGAERFLWIAAEGTPQLNIARNSVDQVMADVRRTFPFVDNGNAVTGTVTNHYGGACGLYAQSLGIPGFLFETPEDVGTGMMNTDVIYYAEQALITFITNLYRRERRRIEDQ